MAEYIAPHPGIEVSGTSMRATFAALGPHVAIARRVFAEHGIGEPAADAWYPLQSALNALKQLARASGDHTLLEIGKRMPENALWPNEPKSIEDGVASIDLAYHMNHRLDGEVLLDFSTGDMRGGIGHYRCVSSGKRGLTIVCDTPYPSELDRGIVLGVVRRAAPDGLKARIEVALDASQPTRRRGAESCTFLVTW